MTNHHGGHVPPISLQDAMRFTTRTAQYPFAGSGQVQALMYVGLGLNGEAGEVADEIKKVARDDGGMATEARRMRIFKELGDVMWYWLRACDELGFDPNEVVRANQTKLTERHAHGTIKGDGEDRTPARSPQTPGLGGTLIDGWPGVGA